MPLFSCMRPFANFKKYQDLLREVDVETTQAPETGQRA